MWKQILLLLSILLLMVLSIGCIGASVKSQTDAPSLTSTFVLDKEQVYENLERQFALDYPSGWTLYDASSFVLLTPSEADFKSGSGTSLSRTIFQFLPRKPYPGGSEPPTLPAKSAVVAQSILDTFEEHEILEPIKTVNINDHDGAIFLVEGPGEIHHYIIVLRINYNTSINLSALGSADRSEEMQAILNAIALNIRPLGEN